MQTRSDIGWNQVKALLPSGYETLARQMGVIGDYPVHLNAKITSAEELLRLCFMHVELGVGVKTTGAIAQAADIINISGVAIHKRLKKSGDYLAHVAAQAIGAGKEFNTDAWAGYEIVIADATSIAGARGTAARVHYALRLNDLQPVHIEATSEKQGESFFRFDVKPGQLWMGDRAYGHSQNIAHVVDAGGDVLVRYAHGPLPLYDGNGQRIDVLKKLETLTDPRRPREWNAWVHVDNHERTIKGRLCAVRIPDDKYEEAKKRLNREYGTRHVTPLMQRLARYVVVFTTVPATKLSLEQVLKLYGLRWQVELHIKRDKSLGNLDAMPNKRADTIHAWLCAKILFSALIQRLTSQLNGDLSPSRALAA